MLKKLGSAGNAVVTLLQAAVFSVVFEVRKLPLDRDFRLGVPTLFLEFLQWLILIFGPEWDWDVNWNNRFEKLTACRLMLAV